MSRKRHRDEREQASREGQPPPAEAAPAPAEAARGEELPAVTAQRDELLARLQRVSADYLNYQQRIQREIAEAREFANTGLIKDLLAVLDDMERALEVAQENHDADDPLLAGMRLVYDKALEVLGRYGLTRVEAQGKPFDPSCHEAISQQPSDEHETPTVLHELQRGYELKGRVIRPARVVVSAPAEPTEGEEGPAESSGSNESE
jgi:molecular chaperone GrpE